MPYVVAVAACNAPLLAQERREATVAPVPASALIARLDIPYRQFTLANGLRVIVHTDRRAPVVAVSLWYDVGSKHEPPGRSGFAHLFEHLMFNGSANAPGDFFEPMKRIGATSVNGTTSADATNFFETVPTASLERALFLESDRMAHLTGPVSQAVLDEQRGVVQNEKRLADNQPYGLAGYMVTAGLYPRGHPVEAVRGGRFVEWSRKNREGWDSYLGDRRPAAQGSALDLAWGRTVSDRAAL